MVLCEVVVYLQVIEQLFVREHTLSPLIRSFRCALEFDNSEQRNGREGPEQKLLLKSCESSKDHVSSKGADPSKRGDASTAKSPAN